MDMYANAAKGTVAMTAGAGWLATTGADLWPILGLTVVLIVSGAALLRHSRRRSDAADIAE